MVNREAIVQAAVVKWAGARKSVALSQAGDAAVHFSTAAALSPAFWMILGGVVEWFPCNLR